jgi:hypothetical protein
LRIKKSLKLHTRNIVELLAIIGYFIISSFAIVHWNIGYTESALIFWGGPSIYLSFKNPKRIKKIAIYSGLVMLPLSFITDYLGHVSNAWYEPTALLGIRFLSIFPADILIWGFLYSYIVLSFYEYFLNRDESEEGFPSRIKYFVALLAVAIVVFLIMYAFYRDALVIHHFFTWLVVILFVLPFTIITWRYTQLLKKVIMQGFYFVILSMIFELSALAVGHWQYNGTEYIGKVTLFGFMLPVEEILWILFAVPAYLCVYEYFVGDRK